MPLFYYLLTLTAATTNTQSIPSASTDQGRALRSTKLFLNHFTSQMRISIVSKCAAFLMKKNKQSKTKRQFHYKKQSNDIVSLSSLGFVIVCGYQGEWVPLPSLLNLPKCQHLVYYC